MLIIIKQLKLKIIFKCRALYYIDDFLLPNNKFIIKKTLFKIKKGKSRNNFTIIN